MLFVILLDNRLQDEPTRPLTKNIIASIKTLLAINIFIQTIVTANTYLFKKNAVHEIHRLS